MKEKKSMIERALKRTAPAPAERFDSEEGFQTLVNELYELAKNGGLPEGFDMESACQDDELVMLAGEFGIAAAVRIWTAERRAEEAEQSAMARVNQQMQRRKALPRTASGGGYAAPRPDYAGMDSEIFKKLSESYRRSARDGKRVPL